MSWGQTDAAIATAQADALAAQDAAAAAQSTADTAQTDADNAGAVVIPIGGLVVWAGQLASIPAQFMQSAGASLVRATYPELYAVIGVIHGAADGTHFTLPTGAVLPANQYWIIRYI